MAEVEAVLAALVDAVVVAVDRSEDVAQDAEALPIGGYLWKFPSEGSNRDRAGHASHPPPAPQLRDYPRKCGQCGVCWVSDRDFELDHLRQCSMATEIEDSKLRGGSLGVARRVWCAVDGSFTRLQWRHGMERWPDSGTCATNSIAFVDITEVSTLNEPPHSFQLVTRDARTLVFQWRPEQDEAEATSDLVPYRLKLDARQWQEYLDELSKYARTCPWENPPTRAIEDLPTGRSQAAAVFKKVSLLLLRESAAHDTGRVLESKLRSVEAEFGAQCWSLCDDDGSSLVHLALSLGLGDRTPHLVSTLVGVGVDCNLQNHEGESPLLLVAASGDLPTMKALLAAPSMQVNLPCALGVTAFHAAANAGDVKMLQLLCEAGAQPDLRDGHGWTALHYAAACSTGLEALHFLCELLTDDLIDVQCSEGNTALHVAAGCGCLDNARALLETAANPHICNCSGETAYHLALRSNHIQCAVAINDYQSTPETSYTESRFDSAKESAISEATAVVPNELRTSHEEHSEWLECFTEDGYVYYYNPFTSESSWYKPGEHQPPEAWGKVANEGIFGDRTSENDSYALSADHDTGSILGDSAGQQLPLCLIPMVSPLTSLDNPTAATKYEAARRRARKQRRRRQSKLNVIHKHDDREDTAFEGATPSNPFTSSGPY